MKQARKPRSYASPKLCRLTYSLTYVKCRATSVAKNTLYNHNHQDHGSNFPDKMLTKASRFFTSSLERGFFAWGLTVARHPFPVSITRITIHHCHHQHPRHHHHTPCYHNHHQEHQQPHYVLSGDSWLPHPICHLQSWSTQPQSGTSGCF